jgi:antitoxin component HigA of HigAB toxin-antitoxin module
MKIRSIKSERDYEKALSRIEHLMDSRAGTGAGDELDILSALVMSYEAMHHPISPPDPIEAIKFRMDQLGMTRKDLEAVIGGRGCIHLRPGGPENPRWGMGGAAAGLPPTTAAWASLCGAEPLARTGAVRTHTIS